MKKKILIAALLMASALCITSCNSSKNEEQSATSFDTTAEQVIPEIDDDGNKIEIIQVTDAEGAAVTDADSKPVTELAVVDDNGVVITEANGQNKKPNISSNSSSGNSSNNNSNSGSSNGNSNNNSSNNSSDSNNNSNSSENNSTDSSLSKVAFLWFGDSKKVDNTLVYDGIKEDTEVMEITFKIKESAKSGKYEIKLYEDGQCSTSFCDADVNDIAVQFCTGTIGVNEEVSETQAGSGCSFVISSVKGAPGDTVTVKCALRNVSREIAAFNSYLSYDSSALEAVSVTKTGFLASSGDFTTNIK